MNEIYWIGAGLIVLGALGWVLPYRWNLLRVKRSWRRFVPDAIEKKLPRILGSIFILGGLVLIFGTLMGLDEKYRERRRAPDGQRSTGR